MNKVNFNGLNTALKKHDTSGDYEKSLDWSIAKGGYDLWWEIYYQGYTVLQCVDGELHGGFRPIREFNSEAEQELIERVKKVYTDLK